MVNLMSMQLRKSRQQAQPFICIQGMTHSNMLSLEHGASKMVAQQHQTGDEWRNLLTREA